MYPRNLVIIFFILLSSPLFSSAQHSGVAVLFDKLKSATSDTDRVNIYYSLSRFYWNRDADSALLMGQKSLDLATRTGDQKGMALGYLTIGVAYGTKGMYPESLNCHLKALRLSEQLGLEGLTGNNYTNIGIIYSNMKDFPHALDYFHRSLEIARKYPAREGVVVGFINIGDVYTQMGKFDSAIVYNSNALQLAEKINDSSTLSVSLLNLGELYLKKEQALKAIPYLQRALKISEIIHDEDGVASTHNDLADAFRQLGRYRESITHAETAMRSAAELHTNETIRQSYHILYADYEALGDDKNALRYRNREIALNDSLYSLEKDKQLKTLQSDYELEKKQHQIDLLNKDSILREQELAKNKIRDYLFISMAVLLGLWAIFLYRSNTQKRRLNQLLESQNAEIVLQNKQLEDLNAIKNKMLSIIGHDLRSPIGTLKGFVDMLRKSSLSEQQIHYFSLKMSESLVNTSHLLDNLLFWAKSQMDGFHVVAQPFGLQILLRQNKQLVQNRAEEKKISLIIDETQELAAVYADETMIDIVIRNLLENAIKFSKEGDTVTCTITTTRDHIQLAIRDTGQGIPPENQDKILNGSVTYTTTGTAKEKGSGLGLSLCKELVEKNGGKIWFESEPGEGTSFLFTLPNLQGQVS